MLIGREPERLVIDRLVAAARIGQSGALVVIGDPGIGKTALLDVAAETAHDMHVLRATGSESESGVLFGGLLQLLRPALGLLGSIPGPQAEALSVALALRGGSAPDRFAVGAATLSLLSRFAEEQPLLLVVDDAHALDRASAEGLAFAARRLVADPIAVLVGTRTEPVSPLLQAGLPELTLTGLSLGPVASLATGQAGAVVSPDVAARLHRATGGNPLAVVELARDLDAFGRLSPEALAPVPQTVVASFTARAAALPPSTRTALLLAAVTDGDLALVSRAGAALRTSVTDLARAEEAGLATVSAGRLQFRHPLVRSAVYAATQAHQRRAAHRAVADALPVAEQDRRAWHLCEATVGPDEGVALTLTEVGRRALGRGAYAMAATAYERAALLSGDETARARRLLAAGDALWLDGQAERAQGLLRQAARLTRDDALLAEIDGLRGNIQLRAGSLEEARSLLQQAAARIRASDPDTAVTLLCDAVLAAFYLGNAVAGLEHARALDDVAAQAASALARIRGDMTVGLAQVLAGEPGIDRIRRAVEELVALPGWVDDPRRPSWMVLGTLFLRESGTGRELVQHAVEDLRERSALGTLPALLFHTARDDATTDRWESARTGYAEGVHLARETGQTTDLAMCLAGLAWLQARIGLEEECRANAAEAMDLAGRHDVHLARAWSMFALGDLALALGRPAAAIEMFDRLEHDLRQIGVLDVDLAPGPERAEALAMTGRRDEARRMAQRYHERAVAKGQPWALARAERALAFGDDEPATWDHFAKALELHSRSLDAFEEARTSLAYGAALRRGRRKVASRSHLRSALGAFERIGAGIWADAAARELQATGETVRRHEGGGARLLTPQELQIARLLGSGRTTREAAAAMFLSPKTVEYHLRHVYAKLGVTSRAELAAALAPAPAKEPGPGSPTVPG